MRASVGRKEGRKEVTNVGCRKEGETGRKKGRKLVGFQNESQKRKKKTEGWRDGWMKGSEALEGEPRKEASGVLE